MQTLTIKRTGWATIALLFLLLGCKQSTDVVTATSQDCQLQSELTVLNNGQQATRTTYTYNSSGQLITSVASSTYSGGRSSSITYTYSYDAAGNVITSNTQGTTSNPNSSINSTSTYEYTGSRLTKLVSKSLNSSFASYSYSYSYDGSGQISTYSYSSSDPNYGLESYNFINGTLTSGTITRSGQSVTLTVANGRVAGAVYPDGSKYQNTYDANGYLTRSDYFNKADTLQSYTTHEYNPTLYKRASTGMPYVMVPTINLYGKTDLPPARDAIYNADGSLKAETLYQYQVNSKGYITSLSYVQNTPGVGGQGTSATTFTYSNCQ